MKNFDLGWARKEAGLTQKETAEALGVDVDTVGRWERGTRNMPKRQWQAFVKITGVDGRGVAAYREREAVPVPQPDRSTLRVRKYDDKGYPVGFDRLRYEDISRDITERPNQPYDDIFGYDLEVVALSEIEGVDYDTRHLRRAQILAQAWGGAVEPYPLPVAIEECKDAIHHWEQWKLSGGKSRQAFAAAGEAYCRWQEKCKLQSITRSDS